MPNAFAHTQLYWWEDTISDGIQEAPTDSFEPVLGISARSANRSSFNVIYVSLYISRQFVVSKFYTKENLSLKFEIPTLDTIQS